ncbi:MAG: translocation/assembly module TamB domain-containing protein [Candidatus Zixiibacteriota bacterium]|nr:MAG: translocation/assembly module TamB domain-containing protein [candidate division Zixibacteria bacterium]
MARWKKILLILVIALVVILGGGYLYVFHLGGLEEVVNLKVDSMLEEEQELEIEVGGIEGSIHSGFTLRDLRVYYRDSLTLYQMVYVPRLRTSYSLSNLLAKRLEIEFLEIDSAVITIRQDESGRWLIPAAFTGRPAAGEQPTPPSFSVDRLSLNGVQATLEKIDDTLNFTAITALLAIKGQENTYALDIERFEFVSNKRELALSAAEGKVTFGAGRLVFKDIWLLTAGTRVKLDGYIELAEPVAGLISFEADSVRLEDIAYYLGPKLKGLVDLNGSLEFRDGYIGGSVGMAGEFMFMSFDNLFTEFAYADKFLQFDTLYGTILGSCGIDGSGYIDFSQPEPLYELTADLRQFDLSSLIANSFASNLNGRFGMSGESFKKENMVLNVDAELYESSFDEYPIQAGFGELVITSDSIIFLDSFRVDYFENVFYAAGKVDYSEQMDLDLSVYLNNLDRYRGKLFIDQPGGRGYVRARLIGRSSDPDLEGYFASDSVWIYGLYCDSLYASVDIDRFLSGKLGRVEIDFYEGTAWDTPYDTGYALLRVDSGMVYIDTACLRNPYTHLDTRGNYQYDAYPARLSLDSLVLDLFGQVFYNRAAVRVDVDSLGFIFREAAIGNNGAWLAVGGRANYDETMDLDFSIHKAPIKPWKNLFAESLLVDGRLSCEAVVAGTFREPEFILNTQIDSLVYEDLWLGDIVASLTYRDLLLTIENFQLLSDYGDYRADGSLHADLAFTSDSLERFPDLPMQINFAAVDSRFDLVSLLQPSVEQLEGDFFADFVLSGTPRNPHLEGEAFMINLRLKYFDLEDWLNGDSIAVTMADNRIVIDTLELYVYENRGKPNERRRSAFVDGSVTVKTLDNFYYDLDVSVPEDFPFRYELDDIEGRVSGDLHVDGDTPPLVTGDLKLTAMRYFVNFAEPGEGSPIMAALSGENTWDLEIDINIQSNYSIKNEDIDAEFAGEITLIRRAGVYSFVGQMEVLRGRGFLFDKIFRLERGGTVTFEGGETFNPALDITGYTRIPAVRYRSEDESAPEDLQLGIRITGTLDEPEINPTADSDVGSREDIVPLLVADYYSEGGTQTSGGFERRMAGLLSAEVSRIGSRQLGRLGVETFEIDPAYGGEFDPLQTRVTLGFYTSPNLYLYGRSTISGQAGREVGFEYRLSKSFLIQGLRDEEELYHLNLKLNWEFK